MSCRSSPPRSRAPLNASSVERALRALAAAGANSGAADWLSPDEACDIPFEGIAETALAKARAALADAPLDVNVVANDLRRKRLLVADMDSTLIEQECLDELAAEIGMRAEVSAITERAMRGEIPFEPALRERVALLKGLSTDIVAKVLSSRIAIMRGAAILVATMRASGAHTVLVSGGFTAFAEPIGRSIGFQEHRANSLSERSRPLHRPPGRAHPRRAKPRRKRCWNSPPGSASTRRKRSPSAMARTISA